MVLVANEVSPEQKLIEELARDQLGLSQSVLQGWRTRGKVAYRYRLALLDLAKERGQKLDPAAFDRINLWWTRH
jgi:hypothetical protein